MTCIAIAIAYRCDYIAMIILAKKIQKIVPQCHLVQVISLSYVGMGDVYLIEVIAYLPHHVIMFLQ